MTDTPGPEPRWLRIKALFAGALEQPSDAVGAWLEAQCGDDEEVRREVESLVASHRSSTGFMETPAIAGPGAARAVTDRIGPSIQSAMIDRSLGPYRLVAELGRGGMGVVFLAERDDRTFDRQVAIKMVHGGILQPSLLDRFDAERRILALFDHPNIARLLDAGTDQSGSPFVVMEYVEGTPIDAYARDRRLAIAQRLELFCAVCDAVQYSHERLVVHRDIKPGNVLVTHDGVPKLLDFGIAKLLDPSGAGTQGTRTDLRALTPESASPEQVRGDPITVASDVYSLGVLLFRLLTDISPYRGKDRTDLEMARAICEEEPARPSEAVRAAAHLSPREIASRRRQLRGELDSIALKALRKEPQRRYASVERFALDIRRLLAGQPVEAVSDSRRYRAVKFVRRHRVGVTVAAAIGVTIAAGLVATLLALRVARSERERAERRFNDVRGLAQSMIFEVHDVIAPLAGSTNARELLVRRALGYLDRIASDPGADASLQRELAAAYSRIGSVQGYGGGANLGQQAAAIESFRKAVAIYQRLARAAPSDRTAQADLAKAQRVLAVMLAAVGDDRPALALMRSAVTLNERLAASDPHDMAAQEELAWSYVALSDLIIVLSDWQQTASLLRKALPLFVAAANAAPKELRLQRGLATTYRRIGRIEEVQHNLTRALEAYRGALAIDERRVGAEQNSAASRLDLGVDLAALSSVLLELGDLKGALAHAERARALSEDAVREDPNDTRARLFLADAIERVAAARWRLGERTRALDERLSALAHLDLLAAIKPADVTVQELRAGALARLGIGYAQAGAGRSHDRACHRARPFLVRALGAFRDLEARGQPTGDPQVIAELNAAATRCGSER